MKHLALIFCCCLLVGTAHAQHMVGIKGGYGLHFMQLNQVFDRNIELPDQEWAPGVAGGVVYRVLTSQHLGLQLELLLEQKAIGFFPGTDQAFLLEEQHLTLPVQSVVMVGRGNFRLGFTGGGFASVILQEQLKELGSDNSYPIKYREQPLQDLQYGLLGGLGPAYRIGRNWLQLEGRFAFTMSNRLEPNLSRADMFTISRQMSVTISLLWLTQLGPR